MIYMVVQVGIIVLFASIVLIVIGVHLICMVVEVVLGIFIVPFASIVIIVVGVHLICMVVEVGLARPSSTATSTAPTVEELCTRQTEMMDVLSSHEDAKPAHEEGAVDEEQGKSNKDDSTEDLHVDVLVCCLEDKLVKESVSL